eukprot:1362453-Amorphochlora_amoeboformis.AAC.1
MEYPRERMDVSIACLQGIFGLVSVFPLGLGGLEILVKCVLMYIAYRLASGSLAQRVRNGDNLDVVVRREQSRGLL